jgi:hypothetical protein
MASHCSEKTIPLPRGWLAAELDCATAEIALLKEELDIKDARWRRCPMFSRPSQKG